MLWIIEQGDYVRITSDSGIVYHGEIVAFDRDDYCVIRTADAGDILAPMADIENMG